MDTENKSLATITQAIQTADFSKQRKDLIRFVKSELKETKTGENGDFGVIPYTKKKSLLKPGAEKLCNLFGLVPTYEEVSKVEDWEKRFVFYKYRCTLTHFQTGKFAGSAVRSCNNKEKKHSSKDVFDVANTVEAVAQKRALVAAVVQATMASEIFDADVSEDDDKAPNRSVPAVEDSRRQRLMMRLYGTAKEHGWTYNWIHAAAKKKWSVESLTELSNAQIEEMADFIVTKYNPVGKGEKPILREDLADEKEIADEEVTTAETWTANDQDSSQPREEDAVEAEVVATSEYTCKGPKHTQEKEIVTTTIEDPWCSKQCQDDYFGGSKNEKVKKFESFLKTGKKKSE